MSFGGGEAGRRARTVPDMAVVWFEGNLASEETKFAGESPRRRVKDMMMNRKLLRHLYLMGVLTVSKLQ